MDVTECVQIILLGAGLLTVYFLGLTPHFKVKTALQKLQFRIIGILGPLLHNFYGCEKVKHDPKFQSV